LLNGAKDHEAFWMDPLEEREEWSPVSSVLILNFHSAVRKSAAIRVCPTVREETW